MVDTFGVRPQLVEGHNGIFEITLDCEVVYTNQSVCSRVPTIAEALQAIAKKLDPLPGKTHRATNAFPLA